MYQRRRREARQSVRGSSVLGKRCQPSAAGVARPQARVGTLSSRRIGRLRMAQSACNPDPSSRTEYCTCTVSPDGCPGRVSGRSGLQRSVGFGPCISQNIVWQPQLGLQSPAAFGTEFYQPACDMQHATCNRRHATWRMTDGVASTTGVDLQMASRQEIMNLVHAGARRPGTPGKTQPEDIRFERRIGAWQTGSWTRAGDQSHA